jgi:adenosylcobinamide-GDP ribazoletransferase
MATPGRWTKGLVTDFKISILFCTRLPLPHSLPIDSRDVARASWAFPITGAVVGGIGALVYMAASGLRLPSTLAAAFALLATLIVTGCLHEDGLADTADGFGGGRDGARKLEIMRDSRLGTYGACALLMSLLLRWAAISAIASPIAVGAALMAAHVTARAALPPFMRFVSPARPDGLSATAGEPGFRCVEVAILLGVLTLGLTLGLTAMAIGLALTASASLFMAWLSVRQIGGQTGDVLGALEQTVEIVILLTAVATLKAQP